MKRSKGLMLIVIGMILFVASILVLLYIQEFYLASLLLMFVSVILVGVGAALIKGVDGSMDLPSGDCYYCNGSGLIDGAEEKETCPRCGGTGLAREDD